MTFGLVDTVDRTITYHVLSGLQLIPYRMQSYV